MSLRRRALASVLAVSITFVGTVQSAQAALVGTEQLAAPAAAATTEGAQARLLNLLQREDVARALAERGVSADAARERVAALTDSEAAWLAQQIDQAPAGASDALGVIVFIFVLLLITDILGFTKIFPFTRSVR